MKVVYDVLGELYTNNGDNVEVIDERREVLELTEAEWDKFSDELVQSGFRWNGYCFELVNTKHWQPVADETVVYIHRYTKG